jgi:hypothetical protein
LDIDFLVDGLQVFFDGEFLLSRWCGALVHRVALLVLFHLFFAAIFLGLPLHLPLQRNVRNNQKYAVQNVFLIWCEPVFLPGVLPHVGRILPATVCSQSFMCLATAKDGITDARRLIHAHQFTTSFYRL